jgi:SPP1 gp7 family putative phage head morphogenesis protein
MSKANLTNSEYWERRQLALFKAGEKTASEMLADLEKVFKATSREVEKEIQAFFSKHGLSAGADMAEFRKQLGVDDLKAAMEDIERYYSEVKRLGGYSPEHEAYLRRMSRRAYLSRLEDLRMQLTQKIESLYRGVNRAFNAGLSATYKNAYYRTIFDFQRGINIHSNFTALNERLIQKAVSQRWLGENYSDRIWEHKSRLVDSLNTTFLEGVALGKNPRVIGRAIAADVMDSYDRTTVRNATALARTEFNNITNQARLDTSRELGLTNKYRYCAVLDNRTSDICTFLDGKIFSYTEDNTYEYFIKGNPKGRSLETQNDRTIIVTGKGAEVGKCYPPMHPNCRSFAIDEYLDDEVNRLFAKATRDIRHPKTGRVYVIPDDMTFSQWIDTLEEKDGIAFMSERKSTQYMTADKEQFAGYKAFLSNARKEHGKNLVDKLFPSFPTKFNDFQRMKYLTPETWEDVKANRRKLS